MPQRKNTHYQEVRTEVHVNTLTALFLIELQQDTLLSFCPLFNLQLYDTL
jgi:hypothetical protein